MSAYAITQRIAAASPRFKARIAGVFYLLTFVTGALALVFVGRNLIAYGDIANLAATACYIAVTLLFYDIFKPVDRRLSLMALVFGLVGCAVGALGSLHLVRPDASLTFFGFYCLLIGFLIFRSKFLPRVLGVLMAIGGLGWLTFVAPTFAHSLAPYNMAPGVLGEGALTLWLLVMGVNAARWQEQAHAA